jgi:hypothetical protein
MFRIGFDPILEVEQQHKELIKQVEHYRLAREAITSDQPKLRNGAKIIVLIGKRMVSLGSDLISRYGDNRDGQINMNTQSNQGGCTS